MITNRKFHISFRETSALATESMRGRSRQVSINDGLLLIHDMIFYYLNIDFTFIIVISRG